MNAASNNATTHASRVPAGFWRRYAAYSLDLAALGSLATLLTWSQLQAGWQETRLAMAALSAHIGQALADALMSGTTPVQVSQTLLHDTGMATAVDALHAGLGHMWVPWLWCYVVLAALWHIGGELSRWQGSPGKRALQLVVTDLDGRPLSLLRAAVRHVAAVLSWLTLNLGHLLAALPPQKRALHDYIAGARVIVANGDPRLPGWAAAWIAIQVIAAFALLGWLLLRYIAAFQATTLQL